MMLGRAVAVLAALAAAAPVHGQQQFRTTGPARSEPVGVLRAALAGTHDVMRTDSTRRLILPRNATLPHTTVIIGGPASVAATVHGDVIVVGGDLFLRPGAAIDGKAVAIGGGVYGSTLASVRGGTRAFRDETFDVVDGPDGATLTHRDLRARAPFIELPLLDGLRVPAYDRVNGLSVPWGPVLRPTARLELDPTVTYRSHSGKWDPGLAATMSLGPAWRLTFDARRETRTNDAWIVSDLINSVNTLVVGTDARNYYRADRAELAVRRVDHTARMDLERRIGLLTERAWSAGAADSLGSRPWSLHGRGDADNVARPNPPVARGRTSAAFAGMTGRVTLTDVQLTFETRVEVPWESPAGARFAQATADATIGFPTFGTQRFRSGVHLVGTVGDTVPPQRFGYLGGLGTLPTIERTLSLGGDQLIFVDSRYDVPIARVKLPLAGSPVVSLRHRFGSAGVQRLPRFVQNVGALVTLSFLKLEYAVDPASRDQYVGVSLSFAP